MTGIEQIAEKIIKDSEETAKAILAKASEEAEQMALKVEKEIESTVQALNLKAEKEVKDLIRISESNTQLEMRNNLLSCKQTMIDQVFDGALEQLKQMDPVTYRALLEDLLLKVVETGTEEVLFCKRDSLIDPNEMMDGINLKLKHLGKVGQLKISEEHLDFAGGFMIKTPEYEIDNSFESILEMIRDELETSIAQVLFK